MKKSELVNKKFIKTWNIEDYEIETDTGWENIISLHKTIPYIKYEIKTKNGLSLICADNHIVFTSNFNEIFVKELNIGDKIITINGLDEIINIKNTNEEENMYDFELNKKSNHRYYTNGILSHNTLIARTIAKMLNVPFTIVDATVLTEAGYVGEDVESILTRLLQAADYDVEKAERGIIFIDEIDKIARKGDNPSITRDVSGEGVQQGLLKLLEGSIVLVPPQGGRKHPDQKMIPVNTKNILFICGGAFEGIEKKIEARFNVHSIGFDTNRDEKKRFDGENPLKHVSPRDLKSFGLIPELIGRLPVVTYMDNLDRKALRRILTEPKNALVKQYQKLFSLDGIKLTLNPKVLDYIVDKAIENKLGARGLRGIMEDLMNKAMFNLPSENVSEFKVDMKYARSILEDITYKEVA